MMDVDFSTPAEVTTILKSLKCRARLIYFSSRTLETVNMTVFEETGATRETRELLHYHHEPSFQREDAFIEKTHN